MAPIVGFAAQIFMPDHFIEWPEQQVRNREMLSHALNLRDTVMFVGAGCSAPLGFPTWREFVRAAVEITRKKLGRSERYHNRLSSFERVVRSKTNAGNFVFILGACEKMWIENDPVAGKKEFRRELTKTFKKEGSSAKHNPYDHLLKLQVERFITSNYDCMLEEAIARKEGIPVEEYEPGGRLFGKLSFTQDAKYDEQLSLFALAKAEHQKRVFHCHGWYHEPCSMVITEADYQHWYLRDQNVGMGRFRQTIDLIFSSNPILFVGFSLQDDDLLLALRVLSAVEPVANIHARSSPCWRVIPQMQMQ